MSRSVFGRALAALVRSRRRRAAVRRLAELDDHLLRDIGIERGDIRHVVDRLATPAQPPAGDRSLCPHVLLLRPLAGRRAAR